MDRLIVIKNLTKGDTHRFEIHVDEDITVWEIRAELFDCHCDAIKLANVAAGGSDTQIAMTDAANGIFTIIVPKAQTDNFQDKARLEIEIVDANNEKFTILNGKRTCIELTDQEIDWEAP